MSRESRTVLEPLITNSKPSVAGLAVVEEGGAEGGVEVEATKNALGTLNGVYIPCLLNILGAVLFMRVGYVVGYAGYIGALSLFAFSNVIAFLTAMSFSAIVTNGKMGGGGVYYMISRSMGPAFGGATGLLFYFCYIINSAFNATAMVEDLITSFLPTAPAYFFNIMYHGVLFVLLLVALAGADTFSKLNFVLFVALVMAMFVAIGGLLFNSHVIDVMPEDTCHQLDPGLNLTSNISIALHHPNYERILSNLAPSEEFFSQDPAAINTIQTVLALVYTTTCGIMVGANLSGDLADPGKSLPFGTMSAMGTSLLSYVIFATLLAATFDRESLQCEYLVIQKADPAKYFVIAGVAMATLSTALGAMFGASRILQAIAKDDIIPISYFAKGTKKGDEPQRAVLLTWFLVNGAGYIGGNGSVQGIAQILTDFFLTACAFVNLSQMLLSLAKAPNYRPTFKYATWWSSALGFLLSIGLMWYLNWQHALMTCGIWMVIFTYIKLTCDEKPWGDVGQAILFRGVVARLRDLVQRKDHAKFWRSSILLLAQDGDLPLLSLCKHLTDESLFIVGSGLVDVSKRDYNNNSELFERPRALSRRLTQSMLPNNESNAAVTKAAWLWLTEHTQMNAFVSIGVGEDLLQIYRNMISCAGLGSLVPNTIVIPYEDGRQRDRPDFVGRINRELDAIGKPDKMGIKRCCKGIKSCAVCNHPEAHNSALGFANPLKYCKLIQSTLDLEKNVMIVRNSAALDLQFQQLRQGKTVRPTFVDTWIVGDWNLSQIEDSIALLLQHARLMQRAFGKKCRMRIIQLVHFFFSEEQSKLQKGLTDLVTAARIKMPELLILPAPSTAPPQRMPSTMADAEKNLKYYRGLNEMIREQSELTSMTFLALPGLPDELNEESANVFMGCLNALTSGLPPLALLSKGELVPVISTHI
eukprot:m.63516 g.63516  ORF g.63516 m.63516 type:complete len:926 (-) comp23294_c0_seq1:185-2962(-)